ncbi:MAG: hypothetical protein JWP32_1897 [Schumannella sp.]|nr:hypothetical protein [Schumannella sp.]
MRIPRWLLPILSVVAAVAVGVAAVLIGMRFAPAPPASAFVPPDTETAQVLQPLPAAAADPQGEAPAGDGSGDGAGNGSGLGSGLPGESPVTGSTEVAVPEGDPAGTDRELLRLIDLVGLSPDLLAGLIHLGLGNRDDDPCAPRDGTPAADGCPPGAPGTILLDGDIPPLWMTVDAWPQTHAASPVYLGPVRSPLTCDPASPRQDGTADLRIRVTDPGTWTVRYWPDDDPGAEQTAGPFTATAAQADAWATQARDIDHGWYIIEHCVRLAGIEPGTAYTAVVEGADNLGRDPGGRTVQFHADGAPAHPGLALQPVGQNLLLISAPHAADETVDLRAFLVADAAATCAAAPSTLTDVAPLTRVDSVAVPEDERRHLNAPDDVTQKLLSSYRVPEGATLLVCGRWFPAGDAPAWESDQATFESSVVVQSPDRNLPGLEFTRFDARDDRATELDWSVATREGIVCAAGHWSTGDEVPTPLCDPRALQTGGAVGEGGAAMDPERMADRGFSGDLVLRVDAALSTGETSETTYELPAGAGSCVGVCTLPADDSFGVATIGGTMMVRRTWSTGLQNGRDSWQLGTVQSQAVDFVQPDAPQIDPRAEWTFATPGFRPDLRGSIALPVDRPVDWQLSATSDEATGVGMTCGADPHPLAASGRADDGTIRITIPDLCLGASYNLALRLEDDDGQVAVWNITDRSSWWRLGSQLQVPSLHATMRWRAEVFDSGENYLHAFAISYDGIDLPMTNDYADPRGPRCVRSDGIILSEGSTEVWITAHPRLGMKVASGPRRNEPGCTAFALDTLPAPWVTDVPIEDLGRVDGVLLQAHENSQNLHLWFDAL